MSALPPHNWKARLHHLVHQRSLRLLSVVTCVVLAGCATQNESYQFAGPGGIDNPSSLLVGSRTHRDQYLANVRSDPLGAYLSANDLVSRPHVQPRGLASAA